MQVAFEGSLITFKKKLAHYKSTKVVTFLHCLLFWQFGLHSPILLKVPFVSASVAHHGETPSFMLSEQVQNVEPSYLNGNVQLKLSIV